VILGRLRLLIVAIPAAVEHQGHETATDNDGKEDPQPEGHPTVNAHDCRRVLPSIDHELDVHREKAQQDDSRDEDGEVTAHLYWTP